jgi:hypothetical protein
MLIFNENYTYSVHNIVRGGRGESFGDGIQGLKKLGVREMTYKIIFVACAVTHTDRRTGNVMLLFCENGVCFFVFFRLYFVYV